MTPHASVTATVTDRWGGTETVWVGSLPTWAVEDREAFTAWKAARRRIVLADRTSDPRGWRVDFTATPEDES